jgi:hypothetical protein
MLCVIILTFITTEFRYADLCHYTGCLSTDCCGAGPGLTLNGNGEFSVISSGHLDGEPAGRVDRNEALEPML